MTETPPRLVPTFYTWLDRTEHAQLDARAACAEQERDEALDARDVLRVQLDTARRQLGAATDALATIRDAGERIDRALAVYDTTPGEGPDCPTCRDTGLAPVGQQFNGRPVYANCPECGIGAEREDAPHEDPARLRGQLAEAHADCARYATERDEARSELEQLRPKLAHLEEIRATYDAARDGLSRYRDAITAENTQWQAEIAHLRDLIGKYGDDGMISVVTIRNALRDGPPPSSVPPRRAQEGPPVIVLCGSTRFRAEIADANRRLTLAGYIVLAPGVFGHDGDEITDEQKEALDNLHFRKIDLADEVYVVNPGGYIGESTRLEMSYARRTGKPLSRLVEATP